MRTKNVPLRFLHNIILLSTDDLLHHPYVVTGSRTDFRSKDSSFLIYGIARCTSSKEEFAGQRIEFEMTAGLRKLGHSKLENKAISAHLFIQTTTHSTVGATLFVQKLDKVRFLTTTFIVDGLAPLGEELDRRERRNAIFLGERAIGLGVSVKVGNNTLKTYQHRDGGQRV